MTQHRINEDVVLSLVSEMLKAIAEYAKYDRAEFVRVVQEAQSSQCYNKNVVMLKNISK